MAHEVVSAADIEKRTYELARTIADNAPLALAGMKATILRAASARE
jgi:enoyl-CoA hydratase/carnithine racemase